MALFEDEYPLTRVVTGRQYRRGASRAFGSRNWKRWQGPHTSRSHWSTWRCRVPCGDALVRARACQAQCESSLVPLVRNQHNGVMFILAGGVTKLEALVQRASSHSLSETLGFVKGIASGGAELARAIAANEQIIQFCVKSTTYESPKVRDAATGLLHALARQDAMAVRAIARFDGFDMLVSQAKQHNERVDDTLLDAIKSLLRGEKEWVVQTDDNEVDEAHNKKPLRIDWGYS